MSRARGHRIEQLFGELAEVRPADRGARLAAGGEDEAVLAEVRALLEAHDAAGPFDQVARWLGGLAPASGDRVEVEDLRRRLEVGLAGRYRVERELGRGGMAVVLLARDLRHGRPVALKVLASALALGVGPARFHREIAIASKLAHPHILPLHDSGEVGGLLYYVMPFVEGETLRDRLRRQGRLPVPEALDIARQVASALGHAHRQGVVHRDVKPANILLQAGQAVVTDFGIARAMAGADDVPDPDALLGTPAYMSPEQATSGREVDARSDIYSLGSVLYEMLAGAPPFRGGSTLDVLARHRTQPPPPLAGAGLEVPAPVAAAVERALAKDPADRFGTAEDFAAALPLPGLIEAAPGRRDRRRRIGVAVGLAAAAVALTVVALRPRVAPPPVTPVIAVLPLAPATPDSALVRLGRDLVVTLSASLDGVGEVRTVDALTVLAQVREEGPVPLFRGAEIARRLGASRLVHGTMLPVAAGLRIDLGLFTADSGRPVVRTTILADSANLAAVTDSLVWTLLRAVWPGRASRAPDVGALTTRSLPSLRAFLEGERAMLAGEWEAAAAAYRNAMDADRTFWLAYWRYAFARWWYLEAVDDSILAPLYANRAALPEKDRLVLESWWTDTVPVAIARAREAVERFPDHWPGWMQYGDWLFHGGPVYGHEREEAVAALERTVTLNPAFAPAWEHLYWISIERSLPTASRALDALTSLQSGRSLAAEFGYDVSRIYRLETTWASTGVIDEPLLDSIAADLVLRARGRAGGGATLLPVQVALSERVLARAPRAELAATHERLLAEAWAGRGAWDSAVAVAERTARRPIGSDPLAAYRLAVVGAWVDALPPAAAAGLRPRAAEVTARPGASPLWRAELAWLDGLLAARRGDAEGLRAARVRVRQADVPTVDLLDRSLGAFGLALAGGHARAADRLGALTWESPDLLAPGHAAHPHLAAVNRVAAAQWLLEGGDAAAARRLLRWFDAPWALDGYRPARRILGALAARQRAEIAEREGDLPRARAGYREFLTRYDRPMAAHRILVERARAALARLEGGPADGAAGAIRREMAGGARQPAPRGRPRGPTRRASRGTGRPAG